jgi:hypothetical protein
VPPPAALAGSDGATPNCYDRPGIAAASRPASRCTKKLMREKNRGGSSRLDKYFFSIGLLLLAFLGVMFWMPRDWMFAHALNGRAMQIMICSASAVFIIATYALQRPDRSAQRGTLERHVIVGTLAMLVVAGVLEFGQIFTVDRQARVTDFLINAVTMVLSGVLVLLLARWIGRISRAAYSRSLREEAKTLLALAERSNDTADAATLRAMATKFAKLADDFDKG